MQCLYAPSSPRGGAGLPWPYLGLSTQASGKGWGSVSQTGIVSKWPHGVCSPSLRKEELPASVSKRGPQNFPSFQGAIPASVPRGCQRAVVLISFESLIRTGLLNKASLPSTSSPASHCIPLLQPHPGLARGSLNISLPEVAIVRQLVGLAGGALDHFVGDA